MARRRGPAPRPPSSTGRSGAKDLATVRACASFSRSRRHRKEINARSASDPRADPGGAGFGRRLGSRLRCTARSRRFRCPHRERRGPRSPPGYAPVPARRRPWESGRPDGPPPMAAVDHAASWVAVSGGPVQQIDDDDQPSTVAIRRCDPLPAEHLLCLFGGPGDHPKGQRSVPLMGRVGVRQPLDPVPVRGRGSAADQDAHLRRAVRPEHLRDQCSGRRPARLPVGPVTQVTASIATGRQTGWSSSGPQLSTSSRAAARQTGS